MVTQVSTPTMEEQMALSLVSHVPDLIDSRGWTFDQFAGYCRIEGLSDFTARRLADGDTRMNTETLYKVCKALSVDIGDVLSRTDM